MRPTTPVTQTQTFALQPLHGSQTCPPWGINTARPTMHAPAEASPQPTSRGKLGCCLRGLISARPLPATAQPPRLPSSVPPPPLRLLRAPVTPIAWAARPAPSPPRPAGPSTTEVAPPPPATRAFSRPRPSPAPDAAELPPCPPCRHVAQAAGRSLAFACTHPQRRLGPYAPAPPAPVRRQAWLPPLTNCHAPPSVRGPSPPARATGPLPPPAWPLLPAALVSTASPAPTPASVAPHWPPLRPGTAGAGPAAPAPQLPGPGGAAGGSGAPALGPPAPACRRRELVGHAATRCEDGVRAGREGQARV